MSWSLFIDEPIDPQGDNPYKVVAGLAIEDKHIWPLAVKLSDANLQYFGRQLRSSNSAYLKGHYLLGRDIFADVRVKGQVNNVERLRLINEALDGNKSPICQSALAQAKISYCRFVISLLRDFEVRAFAVMAPSSQEPLFVTTQLRRDYTFMLERFFYFIDAQVPASTGYLFLSDLNKYTVSANMISDYFLKTSKGKYRSRALMPEPVFVRGRINVIFQATSLLAYTLSGSFRTPAMNEPKRSELEEFESIFRSMRFLHTSEDGKKDWSFKFITEY